MSPCDENPSPNHPGRSAFITACLLWRWKRIHLQRVRRVVVSLASWKRKPPRGSRAHVTFVENFALALTLELKPRNLETTDMLEVFTNCNYNRHWYTVLTVFFCRWSRVVADILEPQTCRLRINHHVAHFIPPKPVSVGSMAVGCSLFSRFFRGSVLVTHWTSAVEGGMLYM